MSDDGKSRIGWVAVWVGPDDIGAGVLAGWWLACTREDLAAMIRHFAGVYGVGEDAAKNWKPVRVRITPVTEKGKVKRAK